MIVNPINYSSGGGGELEYVPITTYAELISALAVANAKPLRIMNDLTATAELSTAVINTIDLHGQTITGTGAFRWLTASWGANLSIKDSVGTGCITGFAAADYGGWVYLADGANISIYGGTISNCSAATNGGAIYAESGEHSLSLHGGTITGCSATNGGAVFIKSCDFYIYGGSITNCTASAKGGAFNGSNTGNIFMYGGHITGCNAVTGGGGIYLNAIKFFFAGPAAVQGNTVTPSGGTPTVNNVQKNTSGKFILYGALLGNIGITSDLGVGKTIGQAISGASGQENVHSDTTRTVIGSIDGTNLKWATAT